MARVDPLDPDIVRSLALPAAYPDDPSAALGVEQIQTHLSHVFLTGDRVAKLRKAVDLAFVSFADRATRNADCLREVELNRRLAPGVYLGVSEVEVQSVDGPRRSYCLGPLQRDAQSLREDREHCVVMKRLPDNLDARSLVRDGALSTTAIDHAAALIARFHRANSLGRPAPFEAEEWWKRNWEPARANFDLIANSGCPGIDRTRVQTIAELNRHRFDERRPTVETRRVEGRAVHGHGDLHLQHIWYPELDGEPVIIDCVEFSESLRQIDGASEIAFLAMDLRFSGESALAERLLRQYASALDDFGLYDMVDLFVSYRAAVRAKVAALASTDSAIPPTQRDQETARALAYLELAAEALARRDPGPVLVVCGTVGSGKSTAAEALASQVGGALISSDRIRKQRLGRDPDEPTPAAEIASLYTPGRVAAVYDAVLERARRVSRSGRPAILDATFSRRPDRLRAQALAQELGSNCVLVELSCSARVASERVEARQRRASDASDAGPERVVPSRETFEPPSSDEWPAASIIRIDTDTPDWQRSLRDQIAARLVPDDAWS